MALFDKLKEKVNNVVDVDKLKKTVDKTVSSVKSEVDKALDPSIREKELEEKREQARLQKEQEEREKQERLNAFIESINIDEEFNYIFSVLEKSNSINKSNFEKGLKQILEKNGNPYEVKDILPAVQKALFHRAFACKDNSAMIVAMEYFKINIIHYEFSTKYALFVDPTTNPAVHTICAHQFIQTLYGIAGHALNYSKKGHSECNYQAITPEDFLEVIENSNMLKSYTDADPFKADETRKQWAEEMYNAPLDMVKSSALNEMLENELFIDEAYFLTYMFIYKSSDGSEYNDNISIDKIASTYMSYVEEYHKNRYSI